MFEFLQNIVLDWLPFLVDLVFLVGIVFFVWFALEREKNTGEY